MLLLCVAVVVYEDVCWFVLVCVCACGMSCCVLIRVGMCLCVFLCVDVLMYVEVCW
jgi:hypothetical protein